jgi:Arginyl tRNA synthetase N terminal domain
MKACLEHQISDSCLKHFGLDVKARLYKKTFSDYSLDLPLRLAKQGKGNALDIAHTLVSDLKHHAGIEKLEVHHPGFVNIFIKKAYFNQCMVQAINHFSLKRRQDISNDYDWDQIFYAYLRLKIVLNHLKVVPPINFSLPLTLPEKKIYDCLDELLSDLNLSDAVAAFQNLQHLAEAIHGYFNTITLLCDNQVNDVLQMPVFLLTVHVFEKTFEWFEVSCPERI